VILGGQARSGFPTSFTEIGGGYVRTELPVALLVLLGAAILLGILLHATRFGRYLYTLGSNREATRFSGVPDTRVRVTVFALSGFMAGVAGIVYMGYFGSVQADAASGSELISVVTAVVLGGVDIFGGSGSTLIACEQTNRTAYLMEIDPAYCDVIRRRYEAFMAQKQAAA